MLANLNIKGKEAPYDAKRECHVLFKARTNRMDTDHDGGLCGLWIFYVLV